MSDLTQTGAPEPADPARTLDSRPGDAPGAPESVPDPPGYALLGEIGQGGMGVVYRARDLELDREVAVKVLRGRYRAGFAAAARFLDEARITARLQHPGIPAVYRVGELPDARPFLAMKLIKGRTLDELLRADGPGAARWLGAFESVCHAVGYAHARGVIHRDLKPHNVMVGAFGEVQVMDWGLAKVLGDTAAPVSAPAEAIAQSEVYLPRDSDGTLTQAGSVLGTPAFMPPEQAAGEVEKIDRRADVFGLGAILCALLTGMPPYDGTTAESVRLAAVRGNTIAAFALLDACGADAEIVSLCKRCMGFEPSDRPADADAVAREVARIRTAAAERAADAERAKLAAEVQIGEQRKRRRVIERAAVVVIAVFAAGVGASLWQAQKARTEAREARTAREQEQHERARADARLKVAAEAVSRSITRIGEPLWATRPELQPERKAVLTDAIGFLNSLGDEDRGAPAVREQLARAHRLLAAALLGLSEYDHVGPVLEEAEKLYAGLVAEFPRDPAHRRGLVEVTLFRAHAEALRGRNADALAVYQKAHRMAEETVALDPASEESQLALADIKSALAMFFSIQNPARAAEFHAQALKIGEELHTARPRSYRSTLVVVTSLVNLGATDSMTGRLKEALERFDRADGLLTELDKLTPPTARSVEITGLTRAALATSRGAVLFRTGNRDAGLALAAEGQRQLDKLLEMQPKAFPLRIQKLNFALVNFEMLSRAGRSKDAEAVFATFERERAALLRDTPSASWLNVLGVVQRTSLLVEQARAGRADLVDRTATELLAPGAPEVPVVRYNLACAYAQLAQFGPAE
jgi:tetratricopeptide (TPR) repeat protein